MLTAIVISFGMTAVVVVMALRAYLETGNDHVDLPGRLPRPEPATTTGSSAATNRPRAGGEEGGVRAWITP